MPFLIGGAKLLGDDFHCYLVEYMRTIIYTIPGLKLSECAYESWLILDEPKFRASVVVDPFAYLKDEGISDQFQFEDNFRKALSEACPSPSSRTAVPLYLVIQFKEDLRRFPAVDGQCRRVLFDGVERFIFVECGEPYTPNPNERKSKINAVLTAVRSEFGVSDGMEPCFNTRCYKEADGRCIHPIRFNVSEPTVQLTSPIETDDVSDRARAARVFVEQIEGVFQVPHPEFQNAYGPEFHECLEELLESLQLDKTRDPMYLRLWYLQLSDRLEKFGKQCRPRLQLGNVESLKDEYDHRNLIAHRGVGRTDDRLLGSIQTKAIEIIKRKTRGPQGNFDKDS